MAKPTHDIEREEFEAKILELADELERCAREAATESAAPAPAKAQQAIAEIDDDLEDAAGESPPPERESDRSVLAQILDQLKRKNALESTNEKLFETLHKELRGYKDAFLFEALQKPFVRDLMLLLDDMKGLPAQFHQDTPSPAVQNLENAIENLQEILTRLDVVEISQTTGQVDLRLHKIIDLEPADSKQEDGKIVRVLRPGFLWRERVLRPVEVVARRWSDDRDEAAPENS